MMTFQKIIIQWMIIQIVQLNYEEFNDCCYFVLLKIISRTTMPDFVFRVGGLANESAGQI